MQELYKMINSKISQIKMGIKLHENQKSAIRDLILTKMCLVGYNKTDCYNLFYLCLTNFKPT